MPWRGHRRLHPGLVGRSHAVYVDDCLVRQASWQFSREVSVGDLYSLNCEAERRRVSLSTVEGDLRTELEQCQQGKAASSSMFAVDV